jgi:hypothetical protein|uniref:Uncharacterized protein n=1 Tax=Hydrogenobacter sp. TaxID=2152829 RepID=A0A7C2Z2G2_9AQUI
MVFLALALLVLGVLFIIGTFLKPKSEKEAENLRVFIEHKKAFRIAGAVLILISLAIVADATNKERASNRQELIRKLAEERMESVRRQIEEAHRKNPQLTEALVDLCIKHTSAVINGCVVMARKLPSLLECAEPAKTFSEEYVNIVFPSFRQILPPQASDKDIQKTLLDHTYKLCRYTCENYFKTIHEEPPLYDKCFLGLYRLVD